jgi:hypothetical protein
MKKLLLLALLCVSEGSIAQGNQTPVPGSEIMLFDLKIKKDKVILSNPKNITNHPGYDNQPSFHPDLPFIYFSSFNDEQRSDIKRYGMKDGSIVSITETQEREFSPTVTPDKQFLSCIIQRDNNAQDLGKYPIDGGDASLIIDNLVVGYHAWIDNSHLALFILGDKGQPNTLHYITLPLKGDTLLATDIGRALHKIPNERAFSFIQRSEKQNKIMKYNTEKRTVSELGTMFELREDIAWTSDGKILTSDGTKLFFMNTGKGGGKWTPVEVTAGADLLKSVTRIAVSPKGDKIAIVVAE